MVMHVQCLCAQGLNRPVIERRASNRRAVTLAEGQVNITNGPRYTVRR